MKTSNTSCTFTFSCIFFVLLLFSSYFFSCYFFSLLFFPVTLFPTTRIPIPHVGRAKTDHRNILGVVIDVGEKGLYQVQTRHGVSNSWFCHNQFELCEQNILSLASRLATRKRQREPFCPRGCYCRVRVTDKVFKNAVAKETGVGNKRAFCLFRNKRACATSARFSVQRERMFFASIRGADDLFERPAKVMRREFSNGEAAPDIHIKEMETVRKAIYNERRKFIPKLPENRQETHQCVEQFGLTSSQGENMLLKNNVESGLIIFSTLSSLRLLCRQDVQILGDGTFKTCPRFFHQICSTCLQRWSVCSLRFLSPPLKNRTHVS